ncbi:agglutinin-2-like [Salvia hispanica]|uniref:agglutinin-2-like n=1 Tax=Salvia hispanica TaxID=49212 RepID=UPI002009BBD9|nr:agglutinin-2-like [Salvia hispanica]
MAKLVQTLIPVLSSIALLLAIANPAQSQLTSFSYDFNGTQPTDLLLQGQAHISGSYLSMIFSDSPGRPRQFSIGRAVYSKPIQFWGDGAQLDFETTIKFIINHVDPTPADGFTFFIQPVGYSLGNDGQYFGVFRPGEILPVFAVEFDIFPNLPVDPYSRHIGIDIGTIVSRNTTNVNGGLLAREVTARIKYQQASKLITVHTDTNVQPYEVSYVYDLSTLLPQQVQVGISASTGRNIAFHELISWHFTSILGPTTSFQYDFNGEQPPDLLLQGDAQFPSDSTNLRLINTDDSGKPLPYRVGRAVYSNPIQFWQDGAQVDFETTLKFIINPVNSNPGDGLAFFIQPVGNPIGSSGGALGIFGSQNPSVFAVEFDPFINPNDPNYRHVGIDIDSNVSKNTTDVGDAILGQEVTARINYQQSSKLISVSVTAGSQTFEVSYVHDLSTLLPQQVEVGISASTGGVVAVFEVISWYFTSTLVYSGANRELEDTNLRQYV